MSARREERARLADADHRSLERIHSAPGISRGDAQAAELEGQRAGRRVSRLPPLVGGAEGFFSRQIIKKWSRLERDPHLRA